MAKLDEYLTRSPQWLVAESARNIVFCLLVVAIWRCARVSRPRTARNVVFCLLVVAMASLYPGCSRESGDQRPVSYSAPARPADFGRTAAELKARLDDVIDFTLNRRRLNTVDHGAWQILHGVLAFKQDFPLQIGRDGAVVRTLEYLLDGGKIDGWVFEPGEVLDPSTGQRGLRSIVQPGTKRGQGHVDQWLAILAQCGYPEHQTIKVDGTTYTIADLIAQSMRDVPRNELREWSWTLIALSIYLSPDAEWTAGDGSKWSIERLVDLEMEQDLSTSACGGTHRMSAVAIALNNHLTNGGKLEGTWLKAQSRIDQAIQDARRFQNPDGTFSTQFFARPGNSADLSIRLGSTGHILEFLTIAMTLHDLRQPWVERAVWQVCDILDKTRQAPVECGALYHAANGLMLYRRRIFEDSLAQAPRAPDQQAKDR